MRPGVFMGLLCGVLLLGACTTTNTVTGREQFLIIPQGEDVALGRSAMTEVRANTPIIETGPLADTIRTVGARIAAHSDRQDLEWEFILIDEPQLNAWALPGGKVAIYKKMAEEFREQDELAAILGHEIAHAVLRHGAEQLSRAQAQNAVVQGLGVIVGAKTGDDRTAQMAAQLGHLAAQGLIALPHSRAMELEADDIGTLYMARAGFDPRVAVRLWRKMQLLKGEDGPPAFLSTHPTDADRIARLEANMPAYIAAMPGR